MDIKERRKQVTVETVQRTTQEVYLIILEQAHRNSQAHLRACKVRVDAAQEEYKIAMLEYETTAQRLSAYRSKF